MAKTIYWYEYWPKKKKAEDDIEQYFFMLMNTAVFGKTMEMVGNIEILNLSQQKEEEQF